MSVPCTCLSRCALHGWLCRVCLQQALWRTWHDLPCVVTVVCPLVVNLLHPGNCNMRDVAQGTVLC